MDVSRITGGKGIFGVKIMDGAKETSTYNEALYQIMRLNNLWQRCHEYSTGGNLKLWRWMLDRVWMELSTDAIRMDKSSIDDFGKLEEKNKYFKKMKEINEEITSAKDFAVLYRALQKKEFFLKMVQEESGKGGKYEDKESEMEL